MKYRDDKQEQEQPRNSNAKKATTWTSVSKETERRKTVFPPTSKPRGKASSRAREI